MNYLEELEQTDKDAAKDRLKSDLRMLLIAYSQEVSQEHFSSMVEVLYFELKKNKGLTNRLMITAYKQVMRSFARYRRFTVATYLSAIYENL